tara:strand:+ start:817 stop:2211 length:1395 start_codon:yes stop_codon:yes gene_type:complete
LLNLKLSQNRLNVKCNQKDVLFVSVELSPDESTQLIEKSHHVSLAIDCSGSMYGEPLDDAKNAAIQAVGSLSPNDLVSIVAFETEAKVELSATPANDSRIQTVINSLREGGGTAMYDGIDITSDLLQKFSTPNTINKLMLFTDGEPTVGPNDAEIIKKCQEIRDAGISVDVFGIGIDYNENLTKAISEAGGGKWEHVENTKDLQTTVMVQMTELKNTFIINPQLELNVMDGAELAAAAMIRPTYQKIDLTKAKRTGNKISFGIKDIIIDQSQSIVMKISISPSQLTQPTPLVTARITEDNQEKAVETVSITCHNDPEIVNLEVDPNPRVDFISGLGTELITKGIANHDDEIINKGETIIATLKQDAESGDLSKETQVLVNNTQDLVGGLTAEMTEAEKKTVLHKATQIGQDSGQVNRDSPQIPQKSEPVELNSDITCPKCQATVKAGAKFCGKCGNNINNQENS